MAVFDTCGKVIEHDSRSLQLLNRGAQALGLRVRAQGAHGANYDIFRESTRHLVAREDLYAAYPTVHDRFKYSPTFAVAFAPLSYLPFGISLLVWQLLNALALFYALTKVLDGKAANIAIGIVALETWRSMQNAQSNGLVAALMILAFVALERGRSLRAAGFIVAGALIKIFPLAGAAYILPDKRRWRIAAYGALLLAAGLALPILVAGPSSLAAQYRSWFAIETVDARAHMMSLMGMLRHVPGFPAVPNLTIELAGLGVLLLPLVACVDRWDERAFRVQMLASTLIFVVLFNHQAERASYLIAFAGIGIWYGSSARTVYDRVLLWFAIVTVSVMTIFVPGAMIRSREMVALRLVMPCLLIWIRLQMELLRIPALVAAAQETLPALARSDSGYLQAAEIDAP